MKATNKHRREFIKKSCITATCICGFGNLAKLNAKESNEDRNSFPHDWISKMLLNIGDFAEEEKISNTIKECSSVHFDELNMKTFLSPYKGKLEEFNQFIKKEWGWNIFFDKNTGEIFIDENKDFCVCPLVKNGNNTKLPALCYCSEGFAERMYSEVSGKPVEARVTSSIQRGDKSCKYHIKILDN
ncbi:hypothetical protein GM418_14305 [Maribellus comscasis]|uniref:Uncharacterized protein n=1 Tax=Maribellus comscasis TaxID=2681766 RepID=A0A6I6JUQ5_9BACT|nr:hypothetical protein [Maribellus comscasis]QGY44798.1 hypothetical protein GM418_14305 [Maribellus comscasis]